MLDIRLHIVKPNGEYLLNDSLGSEYVTHPISIYGVSELNEFSLRNQRHRSKLYTGL